MTSTEFNIGYEGARASSKVLKPPGGGSSDIFGLGSSNYVTNTRGSQKPATTQDRLFGSSEGDARTPAKASKMQSNIFENGQDSAPKSIKKKYVRRNPITGEEIEIEFDTENQKTENASEEQNGEVEEEVNGTNIPDEKEKAHDIPSKPIQTSIRIRNPPGGKSSGIF